MSSAWSCTGHHPLNMCPTTRISHKCYEHRQAYIYFLRDWEQTLSWNTSPAITILGSLQLFNTCQQYLGCTCDLGKLLPSDKIRITWVSTVSILWPKIKRPLLKSKRKKSESREAFSSTNKGSLHSTATASCKACTRMYSDLMK